MAVGVEGKNTFKLDFLSAEDTSWQKTDQALCECSLHVAQSESGGSLPAGAPCLSC